MPPYVHIGRLSEKQVVGTISTAHDNGMICMMITIKTEIGQANEENQLYYINNNNYYIIILII